MAMMCGDGEPLLQQRVFFQTHMASWLGRFFNDLAQARSAVYYKAVARFGMAFIDFEQHYLSMDV